MATAAAQSSRLQVGLGTPFEEAIDHLRRKLNLPTDRWDDIQRSAHDRAFIVAGAAKADLLQDLHRAVQAAVGGGGLAGFRKDFDQVVARHGWTGWTGEGSAAGRAWRTATIYRTNLTTSYAAGRWRQLTDPDQVARTPFWRYRHADGVAHPRPAHQAWNGLTLRWDHEFWRTHFAPNGWGCHCKVFPVEQPAPGAPTEPPAGWDVIDEATGAPVGIDKGFDYAPGAAATTPLADLVAEKLIKLDAPIGARMWQALAPAIAMERQQAWWNTLQAWQADPVQRGRVAVVGALSPKVLDWIGRQPGMTAPKSAAIGIEDRLVVGAKARRHDEQQNTLSTAEWRALTKTLDQPGAVYLDTRTQNLLFVTDGVGATKVVVEFTRPARAQGLNLVRTALRVSAESVTAAVKGKQWLPVEVPGA